MNISKKVGKMVLVFEKQEAVKINSQAYKYGPQTGNWTDPVLIVSWEDLFLF